MLLISVLASLLLLSGSIQASSRKDSSAGQVRDSGSYGIYLNGKRVGTETFSIQEKSDGSIISSELKMDDGTNKASQSSELQLAANGDLRKYLWRELSPGKAQATVELSDQFVVEHVTMVPGDKPMERAFLLPPSTMVLEDNFFTHREVLVWRYIASGCGPTAAKNPCKLERWQFGVIVPRQQSSTTVSLEYKGKETVPIHGTPQELDRFNLVSEGVEWTLWLDSNYKLQRILVASENVEVVRD